MKAAKLSRLLDWLNHTKPSQCIHSEIQNVDQQQDQNANQECNNLVFHAIHSTHSQVANNQLDSIYKNLPQEKVEQFEIYSKEVIRQRVLTVPMSKTHTDSLTTNNPPAAGEQTPLDTIEKVCEKCISQQKTTKVHKFTHKITHRRLQSQAIIRKRVKSSPIVLNPSTSKEHLENTPKESNIVMLSLDRLKGSFRRSKSADCVSATQGASLLFFLRYCSLIYFWKKSQPIHSRPGLQNNIPLIFDLKPY